MTTPELYDYTIVGAGIVGLAVALRLHEREPQATIALIEKEDGVAAHQSGHNSGVIHAGVYYEPGSLKARLCRAGLDATIAFCEAHDVPYRQCGKLVVATTSLEFQRLEALFERARTNGVACRWLDDTELSAVEPQIRGRAALHVEASGIVDYAAVCRAMATRLSAAGVSFNFDAAVTAIDERAQEVIVETTRGTVRTRRLIVCGGLQADRLARLAGLEIDCAIVPFRGDFFRLRGERANLVRHLIYPVPDPALPFLGVHLTPAIDGSLSIGPSAMLALARETYRRAALTAADVRSLAAFPGTWRLLARYRSAGMRECLQVLSRGRYLAAARAYCPSLESADLDTVHCGIRAQVVTRDGRLMHDFLVERTARSVHVLNAPSPAATAALPIADTLIERYIEAA